MSLGRVNDFGNGGFHGIRCGNDRRPPHAENSSRRGAGQIGVKRIVTPIHRVRIILTDKHLTHNPDIIQSSRPRAAVPGKWLILNPAWLVAKRWQ